MAGCLLKCSSTEVCENKWLDKSQSLTNLLQQDSEDTTDTARRFPLHMVSPSGGSTGLSTIPIFLRLEWVRRFVCLTAHTRTHAHTHTHTHTHTHAYMHACTHTYIYIHTHTYIYTCTLTHIHALSHTCTNSHVHTHLHSLKGGVPVTQKPNQTRFPVYTNTGRVRQSCQHSFNSPNGQAM